MCKPGGRQEVVLYSSIYIEKGQDNAVIKNIDNLQWLSCGYRVAIGWLSCGYRVAIAESQGRRYAYVLVLQEDLCCVIDDPPLSVRISTRGLFFNVPRGASCAVVVLLP